MGNLRELGIKIKEKRLSLNLTMDSLAKKANITRSTLWSIENGTSNCSIGCLFRILEILGLQLSIIDESGAKPKRKRASRVNSAYDKKVNAFIIMCVEQFAANINVSSDIVYRSMKQCGILELLKNDYEELHGYSKEYLNDFIKPLYKEIK